MGSTEWSRDMLEDMRVCAGYGYGVRTETEHVGIGWGQVGVCMRKEIEKE